MQLTFLVLTQLTKGLIPGKICGGYLQIVCTRQRWREAMISWLVLLPHTCMAVGFKPRPELGDSRRSWWRGAPPPHHHLRSDTLTCSLVDGLVI